MVQPSQDVSTIVVVTFSGVTSGGMVTSGTTCCTYIVIQIGETAATDKWMARAYMLNKRFLYQTGDNGGLSDPI